MITIFCNKVYLTFLHNEIYQIFITIDFVKVLSKHMNKHDCTMITDRQLFNVYRERFGLVRVLSSHAIYSSPNLQIQIYYINYKNKIPLINKKLKC